MDRFDLYHRLQGLPVGVSVDWLSPYLAYNAIGWVIGGFALLLFGFQIYRIDRSLSTQLTRHYIIYCSMLGGGLLLYAAPGLVTGDMHVLKSFYIVGQAVIDISLVYQAWVAAHFVIGSDLAKRVATWSTSLVVAFLWYEQLLSPLPYRHDHSIVYPMNDFAHYAITAILALLLTPVTIFFFRQSARPGTITAKIKSFTTGLTCAIVFALYMVLLYHYHDVQPFWISLINIISFSGFLIALFLPQKFTQTVVTTQLPNGASVSTT